MAQKWLDTSTNDATFATLQGFIITIDGYEYTAIESGRTYSFTTSSPSQIVQEGFDYTAHSVVQPMTIDYSIVVSKYDTTELSKLMDLRESKKIFTLTNPVHNIQNCVVESIDIRDEYVDTLTLSVTFKEINSSAITQPDNDNSFQMFGSLTLGCGSATPEESNTVTSSKDGKKVTAVKYTPSTNSSAISGNAEYTLPKMKNNQTDPTYVDSRISQVTNF